MALPRGYGSVSPSGKRWKASVRVDGRNRYIGTFDSEEAGEKAVMDAKKGGWKPTNETLNSWGLTWLHRRATDGVHRNSADEELIWRIRIEPSELGKMPLSEITSANVRDWIRKQVTQRNPKTGKQYSAQTLKNALNCLRVCLRDACEEGLIASNPARECRIPKLPQRAEPWAWLSTQEIAMLNAVMPPGENRNAITVALHTGLRAGELWGLRREDVDLLHGVIVVCRSFNGPTKNGKVRRVPLLAPARAALEDQLARHNSKLVFPSRRGDVHKKGYNAQFKTYLKKAEITRRIRWHDLRHTCASMLVQGEWGRQWSLMEVREWLGHSSTSVTERYSHLCLGGIQRAALETNNFGTVSP